jgi:protein-disulfide isomerase
MAPVTIVIFGDLQCPHTLAALKTLLRLKGALGDELRLAFRHRPLPVHAEARAYARTAARAHELRGDGAFWQLLSAIAQGPPSAASRVVREWAHLHGLDAGQVGSWRERTESDVVVDRDLELAGRFDVRATPTVFVNGVRLDGEPSLAEVRAVWARERSAVRAGLALAAFSPEQAYSERVGSNLTGLGVPLADRQCVPLGSSPSRGAAAPLVTIVEFSAFGCQECSEASRAVDKLLTVHPGLIRHVWKSYVAENDAAARAPAALAFAALNEGGRETFWKLHDLLRAARDLEVPQLQGIASAAGLDGPAVMARVSRGEFSATIERDRAMAERSGVTSAPTLLVNGRPASGRDGIEELPRLIEQELIVARRLLRGGVPAERLYSAVCGDGDVRD